MRYKVIMLAASITVSLGIISCEGGETQKTPLSDSIIRNLKPVQINNCVLKRFGSPNDGGYLACGNLVAGSAAAFSYGIAGTDDWGCDIATQFNIPVYQYDPFDTRAPVCDTGSVFFHAEGVAGSEFIDSEKRPFNTIARHIFEKGLEGKNLIMKMDVEGAEWDSLLNTSDELLNQFSQIMIEFHGLDDADLQPKISKTLEKLNNRFYVAHIHANNCCCAKGGILPSSVVEVLYVNKTIAKVSDTALTPILPHPLDASNTGNPECIITKSSF